MRLVKVDTFIKLTKLESYFHAPAEEREARR